ncbi:MAG: YtxH domain-containing protein, partial [Dehalococcoidia bacterium]|nr:YtxH domain-containing protein [Dehalococcoidia bacterium]
MSQRKGGAGFKTLFFAGAVGTVLGILYAPRKGAETRRMLGEKLRGLPSAIEEGQVTFREAMIDLRAALKNEAEMKRKQIQQLIGVGSQAASETRANLQAEFQARAGGPPPGVTGAGGPPPWVAAGAGGPPPGVSAGRPSSATGGRPAETSATPTP